MLILVAFSSLLLWLPVSGAYEQAVELFHHARFQSVIEVLDQLPASEASRPAAQNLRSLALMNLGKFETALIANSVATEQDPENPNYVYNRGLIQSSATQLLDAEQTFRSGVQRFPKSLRLNEGLGDVLFKLNRFAEAEQALKIAVEIDPARGSTLAALAKLYYALGDQERFAITAQRAIQADPSSYLACYVYGKYLLENSAQIEEGRKYIAKSLDLAPAFEDALIDWGKLLASEGRWKEAAGAYERAVASNPSRSQTYYLMYLACRKSGEQKKAAWALSEYQTLTGAK